MTGRIAELRQQVLRERDAELEREAQQLYAVEQAEAARRQMARQAELDRAAADYRLKLEHCEMTRAYMLEVFNRPQVDYASLKAAHDPALGAYLETVAFADAAVAAYQFERQMSGWSQTYASSDAISAFAKFPPPVLPAYTLMRWIADASDRAVKRWRLGVFVMFYPAYFRINEDGWPAPDFNPAQATAKDLHSQRFYSGVGR